MKSDYDHPTADSFLWFLDSMEGKLGQMLEKLFAWFALCGLARWLYFTFSELMFENHRKSLIQPYIYIISGQKFIKKGQKLFVRVFGNLKLPENSVARLVSLNRTKFGVNCQNSIIGQQIYLCLHILSVILAGKIVRQIQTDSKWTFFECDIFKHCDVEGEIVV